MFLETHHVEYSNNITINMISSYQKIMDKFIIKFIHKNKINYNKNHNKLYYDALVYSKYYLYWKIYECVYSEEIMNILYDIEYIN